MITVKVNLKKQTNNSYPIIIGCNILPTIVKDLKKLNLANRYVVITDLNVHKLYAKKLVELFKQHKLTTDLIVFRAGEKSKNIETKLKIENQMFKLGCGRDTAIIALGGGVVGDLAGFVAATYNRGIPFVQIPTTILAAADSSIGGKTGINNNFGKNLIGAFYQPKRVYIDTNFWQTLKPNEIKNGLAETVKHALISDASFFEFLEKNYQRILEPKVAQYIAQKNCLIKSRVVSQDERETSLRQILNYGHTIGHALEQVSVYKLSHGQAIAVGMNFAGLISVELGYLNKIDLIRQNYLLQKIGFSLVIPKNISLKKIIKAMKLDKKAEKGQLKFVLLNSIGKVEKDHNRHLVTVGLDLIKKIFHNITLE